MWTLGVRIEDRDETTDPAHLHVLRNQETSAVVKEKHNKYIFCVPICSKSKRHKSQQCFWNFPKEDNNVKRLICQSENR